MPCTTISGTTISDFLVWPTTCQYYFWLIILGVIFFILTWTIFKNEQKRKGEGDLISALGVSSIGITVVAIIGTLVENGDGIPMIQSNILLSIIAVMIVIVLIWIFKD